MFHCNWAYLLYEVPIYRSNLSSDHRQMTYIFFTSRIQAAKVLITRKPVPEIPAVCYIIL